MIRQDLNRQWYFRATNLPNGMVDLPHDFSIIQKRDPNTPAGRGNGYFPGGVAEYEKELFAPLDWKGKKVILEFEGVYMNATVRINNNIVAQQPYGYTSFQCDLTPYLIYGDSNIIRVHVNNSALPNSRWYSGSGIYRHVWLMVGESTHIKPWGVYATTLEVSEASSKILIRTDIENIASKAETIMVRSTLSTAKGDIVALTVSELMIPSEDITTATQTLYVENAQLWSVENPYLYTLKSEILKEGTVIDQSQMKIGIRSISFDVKNGFMLNGISMKLKGGNVHHDCGLLGAAAYKRAEERKIELLKASGFNAVRCAHNPPSPSFLDACDRLGMLVMNEAFDCWREAKNTNDYHMFFNEWWDRDITSMVIRDRNHPSIILWSTGNEIIERDGRSEGCATARKLADRIRELDNTRAVTNGICEVAKSDENFAEPLDVVSYNYEMRRYESDAIKYPNRIICCAENYIKETYEYWDTVEKYPNVIGDFYWTSMDYLGEAGVGLVRYHGNHEEPMYPWHQAFCGDIDICGFKRPQSYYRDCVWGIAKVPYITVYKPEHYGKSVGINGWAWKDVVSSWTWPGYEGRPTAIEVYSTDDEIELFLNDKSLGRKPAGKSNKYIAAYELNYVAGELRAIAYSNGKETTCTILRTAGAPTNLRLVPDRKTLNSVFGDLSFITVELLDEQGNLVTNADNNIYFTVSGVGTLVAVGNSNPISEEMYTGNQRRVHEGKAMVVVRTSGEKGEITLSAMADGIPNTSVVIVVE